MKNIILLGAARAGKTTLAKKLNEELNYSVVNIDDIVTAFERSFPELEIGNGNDYEKSKANLAPFLAHYLGSLSYRSDCNNGIKFVIEGGYFDFEKILPVLEKYEMKGLKDNFLLIGLFYNKKTVDGIYNDLRKYDKEDDWTYNLNEDELRKFIQSCIGYTEKLYEELKGYDFCIYDVSEEREEIINKIVNDIKSVL